MNNINKVIINEINEFLNEGYSFENESLRFRDAVREPSFFNYDSISNDYDVTIKNPNMIINWRIGFQLNQQGIEKVIPYIDSIEGTYEVDLHDLHSDELVQYDTKNISEVSWNFSIENFEFTLETPIYVESVKFDFESRTCTVNFT